LAVDEFRYTGKVEARYPSGKGEVCKTFMRGFDSHPRLQNFVFVFIDLPPLLLNLYPFCTRHFLHEHRIALPSPRNIGLELLLARTHPGVVMLLRDAHALVSEQDRDALDRHTGQEQFHSEGVAETVGYRVALALRRPELT
jgi:hypothetical protein